MRLVFEAKDPYPSQWAGIESIAGKIGCTSETLRRWVRQGERDRGVRRPMRSSASRNSSARCANCYARRIVGWRVSRSMKAGFVLDALEQALDARAGQREGELVHHADRGSQYVWIRYSQRLAQAGIKPCAGSVGDSCNNALAETINGRYKAELIHRRAPWKTQQAVELATLAGVPWFNGQRLLQPIGDIPPAEAEASYWRLQADQTMNA